MVLYCVTNSTSQKPITYYADYAEYECGENGNGIWVVVDENGNYFNPDSSSTKKPIMYYNKDCTNNACEYTYSSSTDSSGNVSYKWGWTSGCSAISGYPTSNELLIKYNTGN